MLPAETLFAFLGISLVITFAPGPDNLMVLSQSLSRGRSAGFGIALGCALGCVTHILWATLGVSAVIASSPRLFLALKLAGSLYLLWLGIQALRSPGATLKAADAARATEPWLRYLRRGFIANAINPKVALFFLAFMPQFLKPELGHLSLQMVRLGLVFIVQTIVVFGLFAFAAGSLGRLLARRPRIAPWLDRVTGGVFIALAARLAFVR